MEDGIEAQGQGASGDQPPVSETIQTWTVRRGFEGGRVTYHGDPAFTAHFMPASSFDASDFSQDFELTIHDSERDLIYHRFQWEEREPDGEELVQLIARMQRVVRAAGRS
jgi:hypothetical protein